MDNTLNVHYGAYSYYNYSYNWTTGSERTADTTYGYDGLAQDASKFVGKGYGHTATRISSTASVSKTTEVH